MNIIKSTLYIVPTPIGNLEDITYRALSVLQCVNIIAAEDTRHTNLLLKHFSIKACLISFHSYNEQKKTNTLIQKLHQGESIALVSDAGTPLINDPGYNLVRRCHELNIRVIPLPGACAAITALSASGLSSNRFCYEGFLSKIRKKRLKRLKELSQETRTMIFYVSTHNILEDLQDMIIIWGSTRHAVLARELTKVWESIYSAPINKLFMWIQDNKIKQCGENTLIIEGYKINSTIEISHSKAINTLKFLMTLMSLKKAVIHTSFIYEINKNILYHYALEINKN